MLIVNVNDENVLVDVKNILLNDGVIALPTETVYGLAALWTSQTAREKIYSLKKRPASKLLQMLAPSLDAGIKAGIIPDKRLAKLSNHFWPGALTVVAAAADGGTIGLRVPRHPFMLALLKELDQPLAATSANLSGKPAGLNALEAVADLDGEPDALVDGGSVRETGGQASTVVSLLQQHPVILREGIIKLDDIEKALAD